MTYGSRNIIPVLFTLVLGLFSGSVVAEVLQDQYQLGYSAGGGDVRIGGPDLLEAAQTYEAGIDGRLQRVTWVVKCDVGTVGNFRLEIQTVDATGTPSGVVLGSELVDSATLVPAVDDTYEFHDFFPAGVEQVAGTAYAIVVSADSTTECYSPRGVQSTSMFAYPDGAGYVGEPAVDKVQWTESEDPSLAVFYDFSFVTYVDVPDLDGPDFCDIEDASGMPNDWLPEDVPACGCLVDPVFNAHRCWFGLPDFVLWREIAPFEDPSAKAEWVVVPLNSGVEGISVQEFSDEAKGPEVVFDKNLKPGDATKIKAGTADYGSESSVKLFFIGPRGDAEVQFRVLLDIPGEN